MSFQTRILAIAFLLVASLADGQVGKTRVSRPLTPARGHYQQLSAFSSTPASPSQEIDKKKFITEATVVERRLSLKPYYLQNVTVDEFHIPDVPANSSEQTKAEIEYLLALQRTRTVEDVRSSLFMAGVYYNLRVTPADTTYARFRRNLFHIGRSVGTWFNADNLPLTADLVAHVWRDAGYFIWALKFKYARIRPCFVDPNVKNLEITDWAAYPSGHASNSYVNAYLYAELAPEFADYFLKDAYDMAHSREIIGVHYPSDSESGRIFARQLVNMLFENERFKSDFEKAREEWSRKAKENFGTAISK